MPRLSSSASQPHLHNRHYQTPQRLGGAAPPDPSYSDPSRRRPPAPGRSFGRSESTATIGSIAEEAYEDYAESPPRQEYHYPPPVHLEQPPPLTPEWHAHDAWVPAPEPGRTVAVPAPPPPPASRKPPQRASTVEDILSHYAAGKAAAAPWVVRAMRALESRYERQLREARAETAEAHEKARQAVAGAVEVDEHATRRGLSDASSVARASEAAERYARGQDEVAHDAAVLRSALAATQRERDALAERCKMREEEVDMLKAHLDEASVGMRMARGSAAQRTQTVLQLEGQLETARGEVVAARLALDQERSECMRAQEEAARSKAQARELAQAASARPRPGGAPKPAAMGSAAEWEALREERDALVQLLSELRRAGDRSQGGAAVRVGGGFEPLPEYIKRVTGALPAELRVGGDGGGEHHGPNMGPNASIFGGQEYGPGAATHRSKVRAVAAAEARERAARLHGQSIGWVAPRSGTGGTIGGANRAVGLLVHHQGPPRGGFGPPKGPPPSPGISQQQRWGAPAAPSPSRTAVSRLVLEDAGVPVFGDRG